MVGAFTRSSVDLPYTNEPCGVGIKGLPDLESTGYPETKSAVVAQTFPAVPNRKSRTAGPYANTTGYETGASAERRFR